MHLDGCHFFVWVYRRDDGSCFLSFQEREGDDLYLHKREAPEEPCQRCDALSSGARPRYRKVDVDLPDDPEWKFFTVLAKVGEIDESD